VTERDLDQAWLVGRDAVAKGAQAIEQHIEQTARKVVDSSGRDVKVEADFSSERAICDVLRAGSPFPILAEEGGGDPSGDTFWVVDPLDGSANFSRGIPLFAVAVALVSGGAPVLGWTYDVGRGELYSGGRGEAWLGTLNEPARTRLTVCVEDKPERAILATGLPLRHGFDDSALAGFLPWFKRFKKIRMFGSAALSMAMVASGRVDAYAEDGIMLWDVAAGAALIRAAGGWVSLEAMTGDPWRLRVRAAGTEQLWQRAESS
jgi:myo-inositol-1(or 4)-monophosphatase